MMKNAPLPPWKQFLLRAAILVVILGIVWVAKRQGWIEDERPAPIPAAPEAVTEAGAEAAAESVAVAVDRAPIDGDRGPDDPEQPGRARPAGRVAPPAVEPRWSPAAPQPPPASRAPTPRGKAAEKAPRSKPAAEANPWLITGLSLRDQNGRTIYRGEIDLAPTVERIEAGRRLRFPNDGTTFQNRENRLPKRAPGYYREWVVPTPNEPGPGPQRLITGEEGEIWYTSDHYRSFRRIPTEIRIR